MTIEKRYQRRVACETEAKVYHRGRCLDARTLNISSGGLCLESPGLNLTRGKLLEIVIDLSAQHWHLRGVIVGAEEPYYNILFRMPQPELYRATAEMEQMPPRLIRGRPATIPDSNRPVLNRYAD